MIALFVLSFRLHAVATNETTFRKHILLESRARVSESERDLYALIVVLLTTEYVEMWCEYSITIDSIRNSWRATYFSILFALFIRLCHVLFLCFRYYLFQRNDIYTYNYHIYTMNLHAPGTALLFHMITFLKTCSFFNWLLKNTIY